MDLCCRRAVEEIDRSSDLSCLETMVYTIYTCAVCDTQSVTLPSWRMFSTNHAHGDRSPCFAGAALGAVKGSILFLPGTEIVHKNVYKLIKLHGSLKRAASVLRQEAVGQKHVATMRYSPEYTWWWPK